MEIDDNVEMKTEKKNRTLKKRKKEYDNHNDEKDYIIQDKEKKVQT